VNERVVLSNTDAKKSRWSKEENTALLPKLSVGEM
jgi:hypothetical protein